jgi:hypothetical protein
LPRQNGEFTADTQIITRLVKNVNINIDIGNINIQIYETIGKIVEAYTLFVVKRFSAVGD